MAVALPFIGAAIGSYAIPTAIWGLSGATIGWIAGSNLGTSMTALTNQTQTETPDDDSQRPS